MTTPEDHNNKLLQEKISKLIEKLLKLLPGGPAQENETLEGWALILVKTETSNPGRAGAQLLTNLSEAHHIGACFEAVAWQALMRGIAPRALQEGLARIVVSAMKEQKSQLLVPDRKILTGNFTKN